MCVLVAQRISLAQRLAYDSCFQSVATAKNDLDWLSTFLHTAGI